MRQIYFIWGSHLGGFNLIWGLHLYPLTSSMCFSMLVSISFIGYIRCVWGRKILRSLILIFCQNLWNIVQAPKRTPSSLLLGTQVSHHTPGPGPLTPSLPGKPAVNFDPWTQWSLGSNSLTENMFRIQTFPESGFLFGASILTLEESLWQGSCRLNKQRGVGRQPLNKQPPR